MLRTVLYLSEVEMWFDELAVARNIEARGLLELLSPLEHLQVAPAGFLVMVEATSSVFGVTELGLRLGPLLFGLASLLVFWRVAARFAGGTALLAVLTLLAVSPAQIWYAVEVKPYIGDVAITLALVLMSLRYLERPDDARRARVAAVTGAVLLQFSFPAVPTASILVVLLLFGWWRSQPRPAARPLQTLVGGWAVGIALAGVVSSGLIDEATDTAMRDFWSGGFPPADVLGALSWAGSSVYGSFVHALLWMIPTTNILLVFLTAFPFALGIAGLVLLARKDCLRAAIVVAPLLAALAAATVHLLPFRANRIALYTAWPFLVLAGYCLQTLLARSRGRWRWVPRTLAAVAAVPLLVIVLVGATLGAGRPLYAGGGKANVEQLAEVLREGDVIYVYSLGRHHMAFYGGRAGIDEWIQGESHPDDPRAYLREVDALRGSSRAWFYWSTIQGTAAPDWIRDYLGTIGVELDRIPNEPSVSGAILYDLTDPDRLDAATAESFPEPTEGGG